MVLITFPPILVFVLLGITQLQRFSAAEHETWSCEKDWIPFTAKGDIYCLSPRPGKGTIGASHSDCLSVNASLISIHSKEKDEFVLALMQKHKYVSIRLGLTTIDEVGYDELRWRRRDGNEKMDYNNFMRAPYLTNDPMCTWKNGKDEAWLIQRCSNNYNVNYPYYCEKRPECSPGTFGGRCEKQCHCHGQPCDPGDLTGSCRFGCARGWMGTACAKRKEKADVTYYCVNSKDQGTYVSIMIDTQGVDYKNIHGLDALNKKAPWCKDTTVISGRPKDFVNIQIFKTKAGQEDLIAGKCAGRNIDENTNQWTLVIQEREGILMDNEQYLSITCNFTEAETLTRDRGGNVERTSMMFVPVINLQETHEDVVLEVADAFTWQALTQIKTGSPVRLQMRFGQKQGSLVKGVFPFGCEILSADGKQRQPLLDKFGCQESDLVSPFHKTNDSHVIQTKWFPAFGLEGSSVVQLQCSFSFCFVDCNTGCDAIRRYSSHRVGHRYRRDTGSHKDVLHSVARRVEIIPSTAPGKLDVDLSSTKPDATVPDDEERVRESEASSFLQWATYNWFLVLFTILILVLVLAVNVISMWTAHSSIKGIRMEMKSIFYRNELLRDSC